MSLVELAGVHVEGFKQVHRDREGDEEGERPPERVTVEGVAGGRVVQVGQGEEQVEVEGGH